MIARLRVTVSSVGGGSISFEHEGRTIEVPANADQEQEFGVLLYRSVMLTIDVAPTEAK